MPDGVNAIKLRGEAKLGDVSAIMDVETGALRINAVKSKELFCLSDFPRNRISDSKSTQCTGFSLVHTIEIDLEGIIPGTQVHQIEEIRIIGIPTDFQLG